MGLRIVQKSDLNKKKHHSKIALVLAGGAISGGAFKAGGLKALNDFLVNRKVTDFDIYVGTSAGGFLAAPLAGGIPPEEILKSLDGTSEHFSQLSPLEIYYPNWREMLEKPLQYLFNRFAYVPNILLDFFQALPNISDSLKKGFLKFVQEPNYSNYEKMVRPLARALYSGRAAPSVLSAIPTGMFDNHALEGFLAENMKKNHLSNHFKVLKRSSVGTRRTTSPSAKPCKPPPRCLASTSRFASRASITSTGACSRRPTSISPSKKAPS
ncbi:MAG: patatin-like phospholipase family protein [Deltaproteobacteria bacterium]|nr:patatin-like phospholipase family protein [Deltaproteobacteria bacterium]